MIGQARTSRTAAAPGLAKRTLVALTAAAVLIVTLDVAPASAQARQPFFVNSTTDARDAKLGDGICATNTGVCTLRAAIQEANALPGPDVIDVTPGTYTLTIAAMNEDAAATGDLDITDDLTITRSGAGFVTIDGGSVDRVFDIFAPATVTISQVVIQNGSAGADDGGGVRNTGTLTLSSVAVINNTADSGGGIDNIGAGSMQLTNVTLNGNAANSRGGAIFNKSGSSMHLTNVTVSDNTGPMPAGSGIDNFGTAEIENTIINGTCAGMTVNSLGHNIAAGDSGTCGFSESSDISNISQALLMLGPLQDNGGFTLTQALLAGSVAVDAGDNADCPQTDQRGHLRPADGNQDGDAVCDIGAYEAAGPVPPTPTPSFTPTGTNTPVPTVPTSTPTATSPQTSTSTPQPPTRTPGGASIALGTVTGSPGDGVTFSAVLNAGSAMIAGTQNTISFDSANTPLSVAGIGGPDCTINPLLNKQPVFVFKPNDCSGTSCTMVLAVLVPSFPITVIPDGSVLYTCKVSISLSAAVGEYPLIVSGVVLNDPIGSRVPAGGTDGRIVVVPPSTPTPTASSTVAPTNTPTATPTPSSTVTPTATATRIPCIGDCNGSDSVTVDEILTLVNIALGNASAETCKAGDTNNDMQITIDEIIAAVHNALNGCAQLHS